MDGHIHYGADFLGNDYKAWENFFTIYFECEELFYKMCNKVGELPREGFTQFAKASNESISSIFENGEISIKSKEDLDLVLNSLRDEKHRGINFGNIQEEGINTIEVRMPNGTIDINTLRQNIFLFGQLLNISKQMSTDLDYKRNEFIELKNHNLTEQKKVEKLLSLLFDTEKNKMIYRERWESVKDNNEFEQVKAQTPTFQRYSMREQTKEMLSETKVEDRQAFTRSIGKVLREKISSLFQFQR